jgi:hypothetical protein
VAGAAVTFSDASIALDAIRSRGDLAVDTGGPRPCAKGRLAVEQLDLDPYLAPDGAAAARPSAAAAGWSDAPLDVAGLKRAGADHRAAGSAELSARRDRDRDRSGGPIVTWCGHRRGTARPTPSEANTKARGCKW